MTTLTATAPLAGDTRLSTARRVFLASLAVNSALTLLCVVSYFTGFGASVVGKITLDGQTAARILWSRPSP